MITDASITAITDQVTMHELCDSLGIALKTVTGGKHAGKCPIHGGKGKNFKVKGQVARCFSQCGKTWNTVSLLMEYRQLSFPEAIEHLSHLAGIPVEYVQDRTPEEQAVATAKRQHQEALRIAAEAAITFYEKGQTVLDDEKAEVRFDRGEGKPAFTLSQATVTDFRICLTPNANALLQYVTQQGGIDIDLLDEIGFVGGKEKARRYDVFRNRMMMPITDHLGRVVSAAGRVTPTNTSRAKWLNAGNSAIFSKGETLFGLQQNIEAIRRGGAKIVEGYADVLTPYDHGIRDHVAQMGTAFAEGQLSLLRRFTDTATLIYDQDEAGRKAARRNVPLFLAAGFFTNVCFLPEKTEADPDNGIEAEKYDPDSYIRDLGPVVYKQYLRDETIDGFRWLITDMLGEYADPKTETPVSLATEVINLGAEILATISEDVYKSHAQAWMEKQLGDKKQAKILAKRATDYTVENDQGYDGPTYTKEEADSIFKYCIYDREGRIYSADNIDKYGMKITNFTLRPIIFVKSGSESKMLLELKNIGGVVATIMVSTDDLVDLGPIKKILLATGNFLFEEWVKPHHWARILKRIMNDRAPAYTVNTLGWNKGQKFYAWANGLSLPSGEFLPIDEYGIVSHGGHKFLLPAYGKAHTFNPADEEDNDYEDQKPYVYTEGPAPSIQEWMELFVKVYGDKGVAALTWYLSAIYRSSIYPHTHTTAILNPWGPPGSGKTFLLDSLLAMFGINIKAFKLPTGTDVAFARALAQFIDGVVGTDEYKNAIGFTRIEALKDAYDGSGRVVGKKTKDHRTKRSRVQSAIIVAGQEQMTQDAALQTRAISLTFSKTDYTDDEKAIARPLKNLEESGVLTQITAQLLAYREDIEKNFSRLYSGIESSVNASIPKDTETSAAARMVQNNAVLLTTFRIIRDAIPGITISYDRAFKVLTEIMIEQMASVNQENDNAKWWNMFEYNYDTRQLRDYKHLEVQQKSNLTVQKSVINGGPYRYDFEEMHGGDRKVLYMVMNTAYQLFAVETRRLDGVKPMGKDAVIHYLKGHAGYYGIAKKKFEGRNQWAMVFDMDRLPFDLQLSIERKPDDTPTEEDAPPPTKKEAAAMAADNVSPAGFPEKGEDLPF